MRLLVCGSRTYENSGMMTSVLLPFRYRKMYAPITVIEGDALGADRIAGRLAEALGLGA